MDEQTPTTETPKIKCGQCGTSEPPENRFTFFELAALPGSKVPRGMFTPLCNPCLAQAQANCKPVADAVPLKVVPEAPEAAPEPYLPKATDPLEAMNRVPMPLEISARERFEWRLRDDINRGVSSLLELISLRDKP